MGSRPLVGFTAMPQKCAGTRIDPERSLPIPAGESCAATAAASPPLDPPAVRFKSCGLFVRPKIGLSVSYGIAISEVLVLPRMIAPAFFNRAMTIASSLGI
jgi:hypothetical protein